MPSEASPGRKTRYRLQFVPSAWAEWQKLDGSVKEPLRKLLKKRLDNPHVPGAALHGALTGHYKIKLNKQGYLVSNRSSPAQSCSTKPCNKFQGSAAPMLSKVLASVSIASWQRAGLTMKEPNGSGP